MALKVKAQEKMQKIGTYAGKYRYVMMPEIYTSLSQEKVIKEAIQTAATTETWTKRKEVDYDKEGNHQIYRADHCIYSHGHRHGTRHDIVHRGITT